MATGPRYAVKFRRKRKRRTNYRTRLALLKSSRPRAVIRLTNTRIICQVIKYLRDGDKVVASKDSSMLKKYGWKNGIKNLPAAYLVGLLVGTLAKSQIKEAILDIGMQSKKNSRLFAALKGIIDSGLVIKHSESLLPLEDRLFGKHISEKISKDFEIVKSNILKGKVAAKTASKAKTTKLSKLKKSENKKVSKK